jgi:hypothetical protein
MSQSHTEHTKSLRQGSTDERAMKDADARATGDADPVPMPDQGGHAHSHAAHLGKGGRHEGQGATKPEGNLRHGSEPGALREPPQDIGRIGKDHRKQ